MGGEDGEAVGNSRVLVDLGNWSAGGAQLHKLKNSTTQSIRNRPTRLKNDPSVQLTVKSDIHLL